jgi:hypothetical protein
MQKLTLSQFNGGIHEATGPRDFSQGEWSKLEGLVFEDPTRLESQWPVQSIGLTSGFQAVFPIVSTVGTFLVALSNSGSLYWCKAPDPDATRTQTQAKTWSAVSTIVNIGYDDAQVSQPALATPSADPNLRFICAVSVPIADYWVTPNGTYPGRRHLDVGARQGTFPGVLLNTRTRTTYQNAVICFVDTTDSVVKMILFPAWRRFYQYDTYADTVTDQGENWITPIAKYGDYFWLRATNVAVSNNTCTLTLKRISNATRDITVNGNFRAATTLIVKAGDWITVSGVGAGIDGTRQVLTANLGTKQITFYVPSDDVASSAVGGIIRMIMRPFQTDQSSDLHAETDFRMQPYYYIDNNGATSPGRGVIPRSNVGVMWKELLLLGDVDWRMGAGVPAYTPSDATLNFPLINSQTGPYPNYMYVSAGELDTFYPYGILEIAPNGARVLGMHIVRDTLVAITTAGGSESGVIGIRGNLGEVLTSTFNPAQTTFRKELIKGGIGGVDSTGTTHRQFSCLWPEAGVAAFVEASGGVWYTNGQSCNRLDLRGPDAPVKATAADHVAAVGRHLFVWRDGRLLVFSILSTGDGMSGAWTELVPPCTQIKSMVGTSSELYFVNDDGLIQRYAMAGPLAERGEMDLFRTGTLTYATNVSAMIQIGTPTIDMGDENTRKNWHRFGVVFQTETDAILESITVYGSGVLNSTGSTPSYSPATFPVTYDSAEDEHHEVVVPAGIGMQNIASALIQMYGHVIIESASFWTTGASNKRGDA